MTHKISKMSEDCCFLLGQTGVKTIRKFQVNNQFEY